MIRSRSRGAIHDEATQDMVSQNACIAPRQQRQDFYMYDEESASRCTTDEMPDDNKKRFSRPSRICLRRLWINAIGFAILLLAALFILDQPNLDGLELAKEYLRDSARRVRVAIVSSVPQIHIGDSKTEKTGAVPMFKASRGERI